MTNCCLRGALALSCILLFGSASAQFGSARWDSAGANDFATSTAVDHRGNLIVAGTVTDSAGHLEIGVASYDRSGARTWTHTWHDAANPSLDCRGTAVAVDWEGQVYVVGVADIGSHLGIVASKFVALKYDITGSSVWPTSGSRGSGSGAYVFKAGGALMLADSNADGIDANSNARCALAMENVAGSQPTFAICGPTRSGSTLSWRTVVFDAEPTDGVEIKSGWPVDSFGSFADEAMSVAIYPSDHSVFVTGAALDPGQGQSDFTTVRYQPAGTNVTDPIIWENHIVGAPGTKRSEGLSIALDHDGNAFVTGYLLTNLLTDTTEIATAEIPYTASRTATARWVSTYTGPTGTTYFTNMGTSISLSFEVDSIPTLGLHPYVYVTGLSGTSSLDVVTLRYNSSNNGALTSGYGLLQWSAADRYAAGLTASPSTEDQWPSVYAAGKGNAYVVGSRLSGSLDYLMLGRTQSDGVRYTATYNNGGDDVGHACIPAGAGLMYYTGGSQASSQSDFYTLSNAQTSTVSLAGHLFLWKGLGTIPSDPPTEVRTDGDSVYYSPHSYAYGGILQTQCMFQATDVSTTATELSLLSHGHPSVVGVREQILVYNQLTGNWDTVSDMPAPTTDTYTYITLKDDPAEYVDSSGNAKFAIGYYGGAGFWTGYYDFVSWQAIN